MGLAAGRRKFPQRVLRYFYRRMPLAGSAAPKNEKEKAIDDFLYSILQNFDLSPVFTGDRFQARIVAEDLVNEVNTKAKIIEQSANEGDEEPEFTVQEVMDRWKKQYRLWRLSMNAFAINLGQRVEGTSKKFT